MIAQLKPRIHLLGWNMHICFYHSPFIDRHVANYRYHIVEGETRPLWVKEIHQQCFVVTDLSVQITADDIFVGCRRDLIFLFMLLEFNVNVFAGLVRIKQQYED